MLGRVLAGICYWTQIVVEGVCQTDTMDMVIEHLSDRGVTPYEVRFFCGHPTLSVMLLPPGLEAEAAMIALLFDAVVSRAHQDVQPQSLSRARR